jgi:hypothetical protein
VYHQSQSLRSDCRHNQKRNSSSLSVAFCKPPSQRSVMPNIDLLRAHSKAFLNHLKGLQGHSAKTLTPPSSLKCHYEVSLRVHKPVPTQFLTHPRPQLCGA